MPKRHHTHERERKLRIKRVISIATALLAVAIATALVAIGLGGVLAEGMP